MRVAWLGPLGAPFHKPIHLFTDSPVNQFASSLVGSSALRRLAFQLQRRSIAIGFLVVAACSGSRVTTTTPDGPTAPSEPTTPTTPTTPSTPAAPGTPAAPSEPTTPSTPTAPGAPEAVSSEMQLFLLAGQSNMAGRGRVEAQDSVVNPRVLKLARSMSWVPAVDPLHWDKPAIAGVGPGRSFGLALAVRDTSAKIGLIPAAVGGSPISAWAPGALDTATGTHPYDEALERLRIAQRSGKLRGILWHQGESDATPALSVLYAGRLRAVIARFRADAGDPDLPFVIGELGKFDGKPWSAEVKRVDSVHRAIAASVRNVAYVSSEGLVDKGDKLHFDARSQRTFGQRYAAAYLTIVKR
jgi:hypothetical protein